MNTQTIISERTIQYCNYTQTIRQQPENYIIAHWENGRWLCEPDLAASVDNVLLVTRALMEHENKYERNGAVLEAKIDIMNLKKQLADIEKEKLALRL